MAKSKYINIELQDALIREGLLDSLKEDTKYCEIVETNFDDDMFDSGSKTPYWLGVCESEYYYCSAKDANHDMGLLIKEWKDESLYVDYHDRTVDDDHDSWISANHNAIEIVKE